MLFVKKNAVYRKILITQEVYYFIIKRNIFTILYIQQERIFLPSPLKKYYENVCKACSRNNVSGAACLTIRVPELRR